MMNMHASERCSVSSHACTEDEKHAVCYAGECCAGQFFLYGPDKLYSTHSFSQPRGPHSSSRSKKLSAPGCKRCPAASQTPRLRWRAQGPIQNRVWGVVSVRAPTSMCMGMQAGKLWLALAAVRPGQGLLRADNRAWTAVKFAAEV